MHVFLELLPPAEGEGERGACAGVLASRLAASLEHPGEWELSGVVADEGIYAQLGEQATYVRLRPIRLQCLSNF